MRRGSLLATRRRLVAGARVRCPMERPPRLRKPERTWAILVVTILLSFAGHAVAGFWLSEREVPERMIRTVIKIVNNEVREEEPFEDTEEAADEEIVEYLEPEPEEIMEPEDEASSALGEAVAENDEEFVEGELEENLTDLVNAAPVEEVFGIDFEDAFEHGSASVRVGNTLKTKAGRFVDPSKVRPLRREKKIKLADAAPPPPTEPEFPEIPMDDLPLLPAPPPWIIKAAEASKPAPKPAPARKVVRQVPKKKYRTRVVPDYTDEALDLEVEGVVVVDVWVTPSGKVRKTRIVESLGYGLDERVEEAARRSTFNPVLADDEPVACRYRLKYRFRMDG